MKKAPKRYATGGLIDEDPKKKKVVVNAGVNVPNTTYKTANQQMADKGLINPTTADINDRTQRRINSGGITTGAQATLPITSAGGFPKTTLPLVTNAQGTYDPNTGIQYDSAGKVVPKLAKGGTVKKMTKAPCKMKKGGTC